MERFHLRKRQDENIEQIVSFLLIHLHIESIPLSLNCNLLFTYKKEFEIHICESASAGLDNLLHHFSEYCYLCGISSLCIPSSW